MHRIAATPGGWNPDNEGVVFVEQTPAPIVVLTAADTDIQTLANAVNQVPNDFPALRVANLLHLQQQLAIDTYAEDVCTHAQVIILRLLGGRAYWSYGLEVLQETVQQTGATLIVLPGDDRPDPDLLSLSTVPLTVVDQLWRYFNAGGIANIAHALQFIATTCLGKSYTPPAPTPVPPVGLWHPHTPHPTPHTPHPKIGILFYRAHYLAGNTAPIAALCKALAERGLDPIPVFVSSLRDPDVQAEVLQCFQPKDQPAVEVILNTTSFAIATASLPSPTPSLWHHLNVPVLQVILSSSTIEQWQDGFRGLSPRDMAMNVALPEVDGRIISRAVSFKAVQTRHPGLETDVVQYEPLGDRIQFVSDLAANWVRLRQTPIGDRKIALILANYPTRDARIANGVGLDTPASCIEILKAMRQEGYHIENLPETSDALIHHLTKGITNDPEGWDLRTSQQTLPLDAYHQYFATLPPAVQQAIGDRWSSPPPSAFPLPGIQLGNVFIGIQPSRGYDQDPSLNYHAPDLEPTHAYLAFYYWVREIFGAQAIVHIGKHGNLEWLPGKSIALSDQCYPEVALGPLPHLYPFIVNDPGEGAQAKRRSQAVILDHLTPPMTRAELYGPLQQLEGLVDEYYEAQALDPSRLERIRDRILNLIQQENLLVDLGHRQRSGEWGMGSGEAKADGPEATRGVGSRHIDTSAPLSKRGIHTDKELGNQANHPIPYPPTPFPTLLTAIDGYLCELKEAQIRDGLHIFGQCPQGRQLRDLIIAIARLPGQGRLGFTRAIAQDWGLTFDPLTADPAEPFALTNPTAVPALTGCRTIGDVITAIETHAITILSASPPSPLSPHIQTELTWITTTLLPSLQQTHQEITHLLRGLNGEYIPAGPAGAPTRGRPDVLPTGRNFYSVDIRAIPTETAWDVGRKAAEALIERYTQEQGDYPKTLVLSVWGTSCMRTGGDDLAEALALLGVKPVWEGMARRVIDFEIVPLSVLGRPRVDVTLRISGFFRDAFPNLIDLFDQAIAAVAALDEPADQNPLAAQVQRETQEWLAAGLEESKAKARSRYRIFGSKPGAYGAGLQGLIDAQNWTTDADLARAYINWSSYAYTAAALSASGAGGIAAPEALERRLSQMQIVLQNQDNREHDLLDSDDYYQFQGGLTAAIRTIQGRNPQTYFGDHSRPENPKVRRLQEEIARVYRSRVVNPKWIAGVMRHGYKGAFEMAATVDYLFAYDATAQCVEDFMYQGIADAYLLDPSVQNFIHQKNPWALRDMAERLLEAHQRGMWQDVTKNTLEALRAIALEAEAAIEGTLQ